MLDPKTALLKFLKIQFREFCAKHLVLKQIKIIFKSAGFTEGYDFDGTRRILVDALYESENLEDENKIKKLLKTLEYTLQLYHLSDQQKDELHTLCRESGLEVEDNRVIFKDLGFHKDSFTQQFPAGLPFGVPKPNFSITAIGGTQTLKYVIESGLGLLTGKIYPDFSFKMLEALYGLNESTNLALKKSLVNMNQSQYEKDFLIAYAQKFDIANRDIPVLIPQAWIQWHSQSKKNLRSISSSHADELYRVDFVAFWNNKRYVILVDDISHYAVKKYSKWDADEESYAKRLKEDRKLRKENWQVFRVSNWELRDDDQTQGILEDLREFIGF